MTHASPSPSISQIACHQDATPSSEGVAQNSHKPGAVRARRAPRRARPRPLRRSHPARAPLHRRAPPGTPVISLTFGATMHFRLHAAHNSKVYDHFTLSDLVLNEHGAATDAGESAAHSAVLSLSLSLIARREPQSRVAQRGQSARLDGRLAPPPRPRAPHARHVRHGHGENLRRRLASVTRRIYGARACICYLGLVCHGYEARSLVSLGLSFLSCGGGAWGGSSQARVPLREAKPLSTQPWAPWPLYI